MVEEDRVAVRVDHDEARGPGRTLVGLGLDPPELVEAFAPQTSKWTQIERLCARWGIDPADTVAIGDGLNDLEMVTQAGVGIAMGNADPRVTSVAKHRTGSNRDDGVAQAIAAVIDGRW